MKKIICSVLALLIAVTTFSYSAFAADKDAVTIKGTYGQTEARSMLDMVNSLRQGSDAWYWEKDNKTKYTCKGLKALTYDYTLEKIAMQRAAELAYNYVDNGGKFTHDRPDGTHYDTVYKEFGFVVTTAGENIAAFQKTAQKVFNDWCEADKDFDGQGHRRNMLEANFTAIGIGHFYYGGIHFWVQELAAPARNTTATAANDSETSVSIRTKAPDETSTKSTATTTAAKNVISVSLKKVTVKRTAKKLVLQATVKKNGKAVKKKKVTFKFNGKKYTAKTNSKGVAKVTIKKAVLKKLKKGKKVTYSATYGGKTAKRTVKVK